MLKMIKYELFRSFHGFLYTALFYLAACLAAPFLSLDLQAVLIPIILISFFGMLVAVFINIVVNYNKSMFSHEGYLTHTLPVKTSTIVCSKFISAIIWFFAFAAILMLGLFCLSALSSLRLGISFSELLRILDDFRDFVTFSLTVSNPYGIYYSFNDFFLAGITMTSFSLFATIMLIYMIGAMVNTRFVRNYKIPVGIAIYILLNLVLDHILEFLSTVLTLTHDPLLDTLLINVLFSIVIIIICYFVCVHILDRYLELN